MVARMTVEQLRNTTLLWIVGLYIIFNAGFMQLRIPPGGSAGVPLGDLALLFALVTINHIRVVPIFARNVFLAPFIIWWGLGISRALLGFGEYGFWSLRDAVHVLESLFLYVGFAFALRPSGVERYFQWLPLVLTIAGIYALFFPFRETLQSFSPSVWAAAGEDRAIFFQYQAFYFIVLWAVAYLLIFRSSGSGLRNLLLAGVLLACTVMFYPARTLYFQIVALALLFIVCRPKAFGKNTIIIACGIIALSLFPFFDLQIASRFGESISLDLIFRHLLSSLGEAHKGVEGSASGVSLRLFWWTQLITEVTSNITSFLFGLGYGFPLVHFTTYEVDIREPHNSYVSIFSRIGIVGLFAFLWIHVLLMRVWVRAYRQCGRLRWIVGQDRLLVVLAYFVMIWILAFTEDGFEKPYITIPYYFSWGVLLGFARHLREGKYVPLSAENRRAGRSSMPQHLGSGPASSVDR